MLILALTLTMNLIEVFQRGIAQPSQAEVLTK